MSEVAADEDAARLQEEAVVAAESITMATYIQCDDSQQVQVVDAETIVMQPEQELVAVDSSHASIIIDGQPELCEIVQVTETDSDIPVAYIEHTGTEPTNPETYRETSLEQATLEKHVTGHIIRTGPCSTAEVIASSTNQRFTPLNHAAAQIYTRTDCVQAQSINSSDQFTDHIIAPLDTSSSTQIQVMEHVPSSQQPNQVAASTQSVADHFTGAVVDSLGEMTATNRPAAGGQVILPMLEGSLAQCQEVNLSDIMDVVTHYCCKFCQVTCKDTSSMRAHVEATHMATLQDMAAGGRVESSVQPGSYLLSSNLPDSSESGIQTITLPSMEATHTFEVGVGDTDIADHPFGQQGLVHQTEQSADMDGNYLTISQSLPAQVEDGGPPLQPGEREVFLCGQCGLNFANVEACKTHMAEDHQITAATIQYSEETDNVEPTMLIPNRVSVATQVATRKRPGRKRKAVSLAETEKELEDPEVQNKPEEIEIFETLGKRKVRPPAALAQNYVLSKRKSIRPSNHRSERCTLSCSVTGCLAQFKTKPALDLHLECHVKSRTKKTPPFGCPFCEEMFSQWRITRTHLWQKHQKDTDMLVCDECEFRCVGTVQLDAHMAMHKSEKPHVCHICGKSFKHKRFLRNHQAQHGDHDDRASWYGKRQCDICSREFANTKCLKVHMVHVHEKLKPYQCQYCGHTTSRKAMMTLHLRTHTGEKPFACNECDYMTGDHNSLRRHKMRHTGKKAYQCPHCSYSCIQAISLKSHLKNKHPQSASLFDCKLCQYRTVNESSWKQHLKDHESGLVTENLPADEPKEKSQGMKLVLTSRDDDGKLMAPGGVTMNQVIPESSKDSNGPVVYQYNNVLGTLTQQAVMLPPGAEPLVVDGLNPQTITLQLPGSSSATQVLLLQPSAEVATSAAAPSNNVNNVMVFKVGGGVAQMQPNVGIVASGEGTCTADVPASSIEEVFSAAESGAQVSVAEVSIAGTSIAGAQSVPASSIIETNQPNV